MAFMIVIVWLSLFTIQGHWCLRDVLLRVPEAVRVGESLSLSCDFSLEQEHLYSVKFYRGDTEFYRFVPEEIPPTRVFALEGVKVDVFRSNSTTVTLGDVQRDITGYYKCEVSADAPLFHTGIKSSYVTIVEEPWKLPELSAEKTKYSLGEKIKANCTSQGGYPLANITWYLNGQLIRPSESASVVFSLTRLDAVDTSVSRLELDAAPAQFNDGRLRLRCVATQYTLYRRSAELYIHEDTPQLAPVLGPTVYQEQDASGGERIPAFKLLQPFTIVLLLYILLDYQNCFFFFLSR